MTDRPMVDRELCDLIKQRLDGGLSDDQRREVVQLLVRQITVHTDLMPDGQTHVRLLIEYNFPSAPCVDQTCTGTDSTTLPA